MRHLTLLGPLQRADFNHWTHVRNEGKFNRKFSASSLQVSLMFGIASGTEKAISDFLNSVTITFIVNINTF
jgi:hypothetical protein